MSMQSLKIKEHIKEVQQILFSLPPYCIFILLKNSNLKEELNQWRIVLRRCETNDFKLFCWLFFYLREYRSLFYYRIKGLARFFRWYAPGQYALSFECNSIGKCMIIQHGHSTRLNMEYCGNYCQIWQNVTIGVAQSGGKRPKIGNNVKVCAGAIVLGDITIGDNVTIGAGSVVVKSIPANVTVVGNPARIIKQKQADK